MIKTKFKRGFTLIELSIVVAILFFLLMITFYLYNGNVQRETARNIVQQLLATDSELYNIDVELYNLSPSLKIVLSSPNNPQAWLLNTSQMITWYNNNFNAQFSPYIPPVILTNQKITPIVQSANQNLQMNYNNKTITVPEYILKSFQYTFGSNEECNIAHYLLPTKVTCNNNVLTYTLNNGNGYRIGMAQ